MWLLFTQLQSALYVKIKACSVWKWIFQKMITTKQTLLERYLTCRRQTRELCSPLAIEDYVVQSIEDVSPPKWHLAHTTWFFETFILLAGMPNYKPFHPSFYHLFNSYYQTLGNPFPRNKRGLISRPTVEMVYAYREYVDHHIQEFFTDIANEKHQHYAKLLELGLHHEQQHQELLLMDIKYNFSMHPDFPIYSQQKKIINVSAEPADFIDVPASLIEIGHTGTSFCFDNELPRHKYYLQAYEIATHLVTNAEYAEFIAAGGYQKAEYWLADGWDLVQKNQWYAPLYWQRLDNKWWIFTLTGLIKMRENEPVVHVSYYEADAFARWRGMRLPTEMEWEFVANQQTSTQGNFLEAGYFHPHAETTRQFFGDVWEWTASPYCAYPGYKPTEGALGEYNGKFMSNQLVLRGGSCVTPQSHIRSTYRNFFQPDKRWQFSGIRLAAD